MRVGEGVPGVSRLGHGEAPCAAVLPERGTAALSCHSANGSLHHGALGVLPPCHPGVPGRRCFHGCAICSYGNAFMYEFSRRGSPRLPRLFLLNINLFLYLGQ